MGRTIGIIILVIALIGIAYVAYKFIFKKPEDGSRCSSDGTNVNDGTIILGKCVKTETNNNTSPYMIQGSLPTKTCQDGTVVSMRSTCPNDFNLGGDVYLNPSSASASTQDGIPVYRAPYATSTSLRGVIRPDWYYNIPIARFVSGAGAGWSKVNIGTSVKIWKYDNGYTTNEQLITGDVFLQNRTIQNKPY